MMQDSVGAAIAAERVGYESPSQFSREYTRMFGAPPKRHAKHMRTALGEDRAAEEIVRNVREVSA